MWDIIKNLSNKNSDTTDKELEKLIEDVIKYESISITDEDKFNELKKAIYDKVIEVKKSGKANKINLYATVNYAIREISKELDILSKPEIKRSVRKILSKPIDKLIEETYDYRWSPKELSDAYKEMNELSGIAWCMYYFYEELKSREITDKDRGIIEREKEKAKNKLEKVEKLGVVLESLDYVYGNKDTIIEYYNDEILGYSNLYFWYVDGDEMVTSAITEFRPLSEFNSEERAELLKNVHKELGID